MVIPRRRSCSYRAYRRLLSDWTGVRPGSSSFFGWNRCECVSCVCARVGVNLCLFSPALHEVIGLITDWPYVCRIRLWLRDVYCFRKKRGSKRPTSLTGIAPADEWLSSKRDTSSERLHGRLGHEIDPSLSLCLVLVLRKRLRPSALACMLSTGKAVENRSPSTTVVVETTLFYLAFYLCPLRLHLPPPLSHSRPLQPNEKQDLSPLPRLHLSISHPRIPSERSCPPPSAPLGERHSMAI